MGAPHAQGPPILTNCPHQHANNKAILLKFTSGFWVSQFHAQFVSCFVLRIYFVLGGRRRRAPRRGVWCVVCVVCRAWPWSYTWCRILRLEFVFSF